MSQNLKSKTVVITGALSGIGRATALAFGKEGANVVISGRREQLGRELEQELQNLDVNALFVQTDVKEESQVQRLIDEAVAKFGKIDYAINVAGIEGTLGPITAATRENYTDLFDTNVLGVIWSLKHQVAQMTQQGHGSIVNVSSVVAQAGIPGAPIYSATKGAVDALTRAVALESLPLGVRINAVSPGLVDTPMLDRFTGGDSDAKAGFAATTPIKRPGRPEELADVILFVASDKASFMVGQVVAVDGGFLA